MSPNSPELKNLEVVTEKNVERVYEVCIKIVYFED